MPLERIDVEFLSDGQVVIVMEYGKKNLASISCAVLVTALAGCHPDHSSVNVRPADAQYPVRNPASVKTIHFLAVIAPTLHLRFKAKYTAFARHPFNASAECQYLTGKELKAAYSVYEPLEVRFEKEDRYQGRYYRGAVVVDRYLPGHCQWDLAGGVFEIEGFEDKEFPFFEYVLPGDYGSGSVGPYGYVCTGASMTLQTDRRESAPPLVGCAARDGFTSDRPSILAMVRRYGANGPSFPVGAAVEAFTVTFQDLETPLPSYPNPFELY